MRVVDIIARKRDGHALSRKEIDAFIRGVTAATIHPYQISALLMAVCIRGMTDQETAWLTEAIVKSGDRVDLSDIAGPKVGKHSTGGVGDKVSIVLSPMAAACGVVVPKMSGRGLGHTGGTLDKLESIPGFRVDLSIPEFKEVLRRVGASIIGQTASLAPADKTLYALRDLTATIESIPLISASIMSKKLAEGSGALVLDVKCGAGAFMHDRAGATELARSMVAIGGHAGVPTECLITAMDAPLGRAVGNALEIIEACEVLKGRGPSDVVSVATQLVARMLVLGGVEQDEATAVVRAGASITTGRALEVLAAMIEAQGGDPRVVDDYRLLPTAPDLEIVRAPRAGYVTSVAVRDIGRASGVLGAARATLGDPIDHATGVLVLARPGDEVQAGQPLLEIHHRRGRGLDAALALCERAFALGDAAPPARAVVLGDVREAGARLY